MDITAQITQPTPDQIAADTLLHRAQELETAGHSEEAHALRASARRLGDKPRTSTSPP